MMNTTSQIIFLPPMTLHCTFTNIMKFSLRFCYLPFLEINFTLQHLVVAGFDSISITRFFFIFCFSERNDRP